MTTENLISDTNTPASTVDQLVGEDKKFKTIDDLAKGKLEADQFIKTLESELALARAEINSRARVEELLEQIESRTNAGAQSHTPNQGGAEGSNTPDINKLIDETLAKREAARTASENVAIAEASLKKHFGDNWLEKVRAKFSQHKLTDADINELAKKSPSFLLESLGVQAKTGPASVYAPPQSSISSDRMGFTPNTSGTRNWDYYENIRKTDKARYNTPEVQMQLHQDAIAAAARGEDFGIKY